MWQKFKDKVILEIANGKSINTVLDEARRQTIKECIEALPIEDVEGCGDCDYFIEKIKNILKKLC